MYIETLQKKHHNPFLEVEYNNKKYHAFINNYATRKKLNKDNISN